MDIIGDIVEHRVVCPGDALRLHRLFSFMLLASCCFGGIPYDSITGYVQDEYGQPVPDAIVTLWQDGRMWQPNESILHGITNPQATGLDDYKKGWFLFGLLFPGDYELTAGKRGYNGTASVHINASVPVNNKTVYSPYSITIVIEDFDASLSQEQVSYRGAIAGEIWNGPHMKQVYYANVSIWQDGQMVKITGNPQKSMGNYSFKHLAPGQYLIKTEAMVPSGSIITENTTVDIGTGLVNKEIVMQYYPQFGPVAFIDPSPMSTPSPSPMTTPVHASATPASSAGIFMIILSIGLAGALIFMPLRKE